MKNESRITNTRLLFFTIIVIITLSGLILRVACCNWGAPLQLHPDEPTIVDKTIDMLRRHSWEAYVYNRPDHFEIKCNSILFSLFSWVKYKKPAYEAYSAHKMAFYWLGRFYTSLFGTAMIPLAALYVENMMVSAKELHRRTAQIVAAFLTAFSTLFVEHSAYATPDVVLAFFVLLFAYMLSKYICCNNPKYVFFSAVIIGIGITVKYPAAILCFPLALSVVHNKIIEKKPIEILTTGILCFIIVFLTAFFIAPNLFTDYQKTYETIMMEARPNHLGADGLGFYGNLLFYMKQIIRDQSWLSLLFAVIGVIFICTHKERGGLSLLTGVFFWVFMCVLHLHWIRWGIPMYIYYIVVAAVGVGGLLTLIDQFGERDEKRKYAIKYEKYAVTCGTGIWIISLVLSGICISVSRSLPDTRNISYAYVNNKRIVSNESISEGYTPFHPAYSSPCVSSFILNGTTIKPKIENATKKYFIMSTSFKDRYMNEKERYPTECAFYENIDRQYEKIYQISGKQGNYNGDLSKGLFRSIINAYMYLRTDKDCSGATITIYDLKPHIVRIKNYQTGQFLCSESNDQRSKITLSDDPYDWVIYNNENGTISLISYTSSCAISIDEEEIVGGEILLLPSIGNELQQWIYKEVNDACVFISPDNKVLADVGDSVCIAEANNGINYLWIVEEIE